MNQQQPIHRRRLTRAEIRRRRRNRAIRRIAGLTLVVCVAVGGVSFLLSRRKAPVPTADAAGSAANSAASSLPSAAPGSKAESSAVSGAAAESVESRDNLLGLTAAEAKAMLADPLMILVNHTNKMPENYTFETAECGSKTAVNKTLQTVACNAFLELQKAAAAENVTVWMQSGYRSVSYQTPGSTGSSCATPRGPRRRPRSPMSPGTGAMWAWKMPQRSTPAACALRTISPPCSRSRAERQSAGEETVKSSACRLQFGL